MIPILVFAAPACSGGSCPQPVTVQQPAPVVIYQAAPRPLLPLFAPRPQVIIVR